MMLERRSRYPKVKVYGLYNAARQPKNDPWISEIKEAIEAMSIGKQDSSSQATFSGSEILPGTKLEKQKNLR
jgi:ribosomal protein L24E